MGGRGKDDPKRRGSRRDGNGCVADGLSPGLAELVARHGGLHRRRCREEPRRHRRSGGGPRRGRASRGGGDGGRCAPGACEGSRPHRGRHEGAPWGVPLARVRERPGGAPLCWPRRGGSRPGCPTVPGRAGRRGSRRLRELGGRGRVGPRRGAVRKVGLQAVAVWGFLDQPHADAEHFDPRYGEGTHRDFLAEMVEKAVGRRPLRPRSISSPCATSRREAWWRRPRQPTRRCSWSAPVASAASRA